jgi:phosphoribosyl 1,2-cyclic phosphodiesterase
MQVSVLASGSKGNAIFVEMDGRRFLIDAGISARRIRQGLAAIDEEVSSLDGIFITHEHSDHVTGLKTLEKQYHLPLFSRAATLAALPMRADLPQECLHPLPARAGFGAVTVEPFNISHDAAAPVGYRICGSHICTVATDLGFVTANVQAALEGADVLVLEANHDTDMLKHGTYPWPLKQRILSSRGHLANRDAAWALVRMQKKPEEVFLAHLSEHNNTPALARETVAAILQQQGCGSLCSHLHLASQQEAASVVIV